MSRPGGNEGRKEKTMKHYYAVGKTDDGKIRLFDKYTDDRKAFFYEVRRFGVEVLCIYTEEEFEGKTSL